MSSCNLKTAIGERLKEARKALDLTQKQLCAKIGMPVPSLRDYELGNRIPGGEALAMLAQAGIDLNWLITGIRYTTNEEGELFFSVPAVKPLPEGLSLDELEAAEADYGRQAEQIKAIIEFHDRTRISQPAAPTPKINAEALAVMLEAARMAHPKADPARHAELAARFYALSVERGTVSETDIHPPGVADAA